MQCPDLIYVEKGRLKQKERNRQTNNEKGRWKGYHRDKQTAAAYEYVYIYA